MLPARGHIRCDQGSRTDLYVLTLSCWLMMLATFSMPERADSLAGGALDSIGLIKLAARAIATILLTWRIIRILARVGFIAAGRRVLPIAIFPLWALVSVTWSPLRSVSVAQSSSLVVLVLIATLTAYKCRSKASVQFLLKQLCLMLAMLSCLIVACYFLAPQFASMTRNGTGLFHATNTAATASLGLVCLTSSLLIWNFGWTRRMAWSALPHLVVIIISANRLCFLVNTAALLIVFYLYGSRLMAAITVTVLCGLGGCYLLLDPNHEAFAAVGSEVVSYASRGQNLSQLSALSGREEMWTVQWNSFLDSPWIGHGYFVTSREGQLYVWYNWANYTAHNLVLQVAVTTGIVGLTLFVFGICVPYIKAARRLMSRPTKRPLGHFLAVIGFWFFGWSTMNESIMGPVQPESVVFFVLLGIGLGCVASEETAGNTQTDNVAQKRPYEQLPMVVCS